VTLATGSGLLAAKLTEKVLNGEQVNWAETYEEKLRRGYEEKLRRGIDVFRTFVLGWYNGDLQTIIYSDDIDSNIKKQICSVLAGYVWDTENPVVKKHKTLIPTLAEVIRIKEKQA